MKPSGQFQLVTVTNLGLRLNKTNALIESSDHTTVVLSKLVNNVRIVKVL